jgi:ankyrin repeat protein
MRLFPLAGVLAALIFTPVSAQQSGSPLGPSAQLLVAARNDDFATVRRALENGASPNARNRAGDSALLIFARKGNVEMAKLLIDKGADVNLCNLEKVSPLMAAASGGNTEVARVLLAHGADVTLEDQRSRTAAIYAAQGQTEILAALLDRGVEVNRRYRNDLTVLMWAAGYGKAETVKMLLDRGADPALKDNRGKTALDIARDNKHAGVVELLSGEWAPKKQD